MICPSPERDFFRIYLLSDETVSLQIQFLDGGSEPQDLDLAVWRREIATEELVQIALADSTTDNEEITITTDATSGNSAGWYFVEVYGKTEQDSNSYSISFTLNPDSGR